MRALMRHLRFVAGRCSTSEQARYEQRNEIYSQMYFSGFPCLFTTINPADIHNPLVCVFAGQKLDVAGVNDLLRQIPDAMWRKQIVAESPIAPVRFFYLYVELFVRVLLRFGKAEGGIFGRVEAYYGTVEAQGCGTLHLHMLIWLVDIPSTRLHDLAGLSPEMRDSILAFFDAIRQTDTVPANRPSSEGGHDSTA
ncbi:MAG: hypothetical protein GY809_20890, partial [Planctomycetes bacterium]|nr:hypothetical protein [Planctomycetota bacterium]